MIIGPDKGEQAKKKPIVSQGETSIREMRKRIDAKIVDQLAAGNFNGYQNLGQPTQCLKRHFLSQWIWFTRMRNQLNQELSNYKDF